MANKTCKKCKQTKALSDFYKTNTYKWELDGHDYYCKYCRVGTHLKSSNGQDKKCSIDKCNKSHYARSWCRMHYARWQRTGSVISKNGHGTDTNRENMLRIKYLITLEEYKERIADGCELCGQKSERAYHVDHNHKCCPDEITCGKCVRGIICSKCNTAVDKMENGVMREDYPNYWLIEQYLEAYSG